MSYGQSGAFGFYQPKQSFQKKAAEVFITMALSGTAPECLSSALAKIIKSGAEASLTSDEMLILYANKASDKFWEAREIFDLRIYGNEVAQLFARSEAKSDVMPWG